MKKKLFFALIVSALIVLLCGAALAGNSRIPCPNCGDTSSGWTGNVPAGNHQHSNICLACNQKTYYSCNPKTAMSAKEPTCTEAGNTAKVVCSTCDQVLQESHTIPALPHTPGAAATCTTAQTCTECGKVLNTPIPHTPGAEATCTKPQTCTDCGKVLQVPLGHNAGAKATCTTAQTCTRCDYVYQAALGHNAGAKATCTTAQTCTRCNYVYAAALGHNAGAKATCTTAQTCTRCDYVYEAALGHNPSAEATCTTPKTCTRCGYVYQAALGHAPGNEATCTEDQICNRCGEVLDPAFGHDYKLVKKVAATCTKDGYTAYECVNCKDSHCDEYVEHLMHWFKLWNTNEDGTHSAECKREGCEFIGRNACTAWEVTSGESILTVCPVCGRFNGENFEAIAEASIEGPHAINDEIIVRGKKAPFDGVLYAFTAGYEYSGRMQPFTKASKISLPLDAAEYASFKLVRVDVTPASANADRTEAWTEIPYSFENGVLSFESECEGLFLLISTEAQA